MEREHYPSKAPLLVTREVAEAVRAACVEAALNAYEEASISGLCHEGAWECAVGAMRDVNLDSIVESVTGPDNQR